MSTAKNPGTLGILNPYSTYPAVYMKESGREVRGIYTLFGPKGPVRVSKDNLPKKGGPKVISPGWRVRWVKGLIECSRVSEKSPTIRLVWDHTGGPVSWSVVSLTDVREGTAKTPGEASKNAWRAALDIEAMTCPFRAFAPNRLPQDVRAAVREETGDELGDPNDELVAITKRLRALEKENAELSAKKARR